MHNNQDYPNEPEVKKITPYKEQKARSIDNLEYRGNNNNYNINSGRDSPLRTYNDYTNTRSGRNSSTKPSNNYGSYNKDNSNDYNDYNDYNTYTQNNRYGGAHYDNYEPYSPKTTTHANAYRKIEYPHQSKVNNPGVFNYSDLTNSNLVYKANTGNDYEEYHKVNYNTNLFS